MNRAGVGAGREVVDQVAPDPTRNLMDSAEGGHGERCEVHHWLDHMSHS